MLQDTLCGPVPRPRALAAELEELELGRAEPAAPDQPREDGAGDAPPPPAPPPDRDYRFPRFRGGDGNRLPRWQRLMILGVMLVLCALAGWAMGHGTLVFIRGLEAGRT